jgi:hypothetical protein
MIALWIGGALILGGLTLGGYVIAQLWIEHRQADQLNDFYDEDLDAGC